MMEALSRQISAPCGRLGSRAALAVARAGQERAGFSGDTVIPAGRKLPRPRLLSERACPLSERARALRSSEPLPTKREKGLLSLKQP